MHPLYTDLMARSCPKFLLLNYCGWNTSAGGQVEDTVKLV